jgi:hypothetical protein
MMDVTIQNPDGDLTIRYRTIDRESVLREMTCPNGRVVIGKEPVYTAEADCSDMLKNYDYVIVDGEWDDRVNDEGAP